jgi:hypothetical protein
MRTYTLSFAASTTHLPEFPERTAVKSSGDDVRYQVWPSEAALDTSIGMQGKRAARSSDWRKWTETNTAKRLARTAS